MTQKLQTCDDKVIPRHRVEFLQRRKSIPADEALLGNKLKVL